MNTTILDPRPSQPNKVISDGAYTTITDILQCAILCTSLAGMVTNCISIRAFVIMGMGDGIRMSLLGLSLSDFGYSSCLFVQAVAYVLHIMEVQFGLRTLPIQPRWVFGVFPVNVSHMFHEITCLTTAFLGLARCFCVSMPFRFKNFFNRTRSLIAQITFVLIGLSSHIPVLSLMGTQRKFDPIVNRTRLLLWFSSKRAEAKNIAFIFHYFVLVLLTSVVVFICVLIMAKYLRQSLEFRDSSSAKTGDTGHEEKETGTKLSGKELQAVRQVFLICILYSVSILPGIFQALYRIINPGFNLKRALHNSFSITTDTKMVFTLLNSASTFFVYYTYNSKFRSVCFSSGRNARNDTKPTS